MKGIHICLNEGPLPFRNRENVEFKKKIEHSLKLFFSKRTLPKNLNLTEASPGKVNLIL